MKYLVSIFLFLFLTTKNIGQSGHLSNLTRATPSITSLIKLLNTFQTLNFNTKKTLNQSKYLIFKERYKFKYSNTITRQYSFVSKNDDKYEISGGLIITYKNDKPFQVSMRIGVENKQINNCDTNFITDITKTSTKIESVDSNYCSLILFRFDALDSIELNYLRSIVNENLITDLIEEYNNLSVLKEIVDDKFSFNQDSPSAPQFGEPGPTLHSIKSLYINTKFDSMKKLLYTRSKIFNWFAAEALYIYDKKNNFLDSTTRKNIESYNGKNGFTQFRKDDVLRKLYLD